MPGLVEVIPISQEGVGHILHFPKRQNMFFSTSSEHSIIVRYVISSPRTPALILTLQYIIRPDDKLSVNNLAGSQPIQTEEVKIEVISDIMQFDFSLFSSKKRSKI